MQLQPYIAEFRVPLWCAEHWGQENMVTYRCLGCDIIHVNQMWNVTLKKWATRVLRWETKYKNWRQKRRNLRSFIGSGVVFENIFENFIEGRNSKQRKCIKCLCMSDNLLESCQKAVKKMSHFTEKEGTRKGQPRTGFWERVLSVNPHKNPMWRTRTPKQRQICHETVSCILNFCYSN